MDASCHVGTPISIYLGKSSAASDISIIGADRARPALMRTDSGAEQGTGAAATTRPSVSNLKPLFGRRERWLFPDAMPQGAGRRGRSPTSPGTRRLPAGPRSCSLSPHVCSFRNR